MNKMTLTFQSNLENEVFVRTAAIAFIMPLNPTVDEIMEVKTIIAEAVVNAMIHGYPNNEDGMITLSMRYSTTHLLEMEIVDEGVGIEDIELARQPLYTTKAHLERSGMGMTIIESFSDSFTIQSSLNQGTKVSITKQLSYHE